LINIKYIFSVIPLIILSCSSPAVFPTTDLKIISANILIDNSRTKREIAEEFINWDADVYLFHEASEKVNIDRDFFESRGYKVYSHERSNINSFNGVLVSRVEGQFTSIDLDYSYSANFDPIIFSPFYSIRVTINSKPLTIIGAHIPPEILMPESIIPVRERSFKDIKSYIQEKLSKGESVIIGGDFNTFPSDRLMSYIIDSGLEDSALHNKDRYDFTWAPGSLNLNLARIDYMFYSKGIEVVYSDVLNITGSDHDLIVMGVNIK